MRDSYRLALGGARRLVAPPGDVGQRLRVVRAHAAVREPLLHLFDADAARVGHHLGGVVAGVGVLAMTVVPRAHDADREFAEDGRPALGGGRRRGGGRGVGGRPLDAAQPRVNVIDEAEVSVVVRGVGGGGVQRGGVQVGEALRLEARGAQPVRVAQVARTAAARTLLHQQLHLQLADAHGEGHVGVVHRRPQRLKVPGGNARSAHLRAAAVRPLRAARQVVAAGVGARRVAAAAAPAPVGV